MSTNLGSYPQNVKINSYKVCKASKQISNIQDYLLKLLVHYPNGLTCNEISKISKIRVQSLTLPLQRLRKKKLLAWNGVRWLSETKRHNSVYKLVELPVTGNLFDN